MNKPDEFEKKAKSLLDESLDNFDPVIARRLQQTRYAAIEKAKPRSVWSFYPQEISTVFVITILSVSLYFNFDSNTLNDTEFAMEADIEMLTANESLDLIEDFEFMQWLAESEEYAG